MPAASRKSLAKQKSMSATQNANERLLAHVCYAFSIILKSIVRSVSSAPDLLCMTCVTCIVYSPKVLLRKVLQNGIDVEGGE